MYFFIEEISTTKTSVFSKSSLNFEIYSRGLPFFMDARRQNISWGASNLSSPFTYLMSCIVSLVQCVYDVNLLRYVECATSSTRHDPKGVTSIYGIKEDVL